MKEIEKNKVEPTKSELEILQVLWKHGPSTVRFVNEKLNEKIRQVQYTTTLKLMQIMVEKNILRRDESLVKHVYEPLLAMEVTKKVLLEKFVETVFNGSEAELLMQLLGNKNASNSELEAIKDLLKD